MNKVIALGNLTRDIELKYSAKGNPVANFSIAVNERWKDEQGQKQERTHFFDCVAYGAKGETIAKFFQKGDEILIEGKLVHETWVAKDGSNRSAVKIQAENFDFTHGNKRGPSNESVSSQAPQHSHSHIPAPAYAEAREDDIPF